MTSNFPEILIQRGVMDNPAIFRALCDSHPQIMIITDTQVASLYLEKLTQTLHTVPGVVQVNAMIIPQGDHHKTLASAEEIFTQLIHHHHYRDTLLIALGGGMIGDLAGFCAACYLRGVAFIQMPTTLLAQVDAAIGGKTAVNHDLGKNLIGAFYQPKHIICDISLLASLSQREWIAGLAEVLKYGLTLDPSLFEWIETHILLILEKDPHVLESIVRRSSQLKMGIVAQDEREQGMRMVLNFGHTLAHALEALFDFKTLSHGEGVSIGLLAALMVSEKETGLEKTLLPRLKALLIQIGLPTQIPGSLKVVDLIEKMKGDKKNNTHKKKWVLLRELGQPVIIENVADQTLRDVLIALSAH